MLPMLAAATLLLFAGVWWTIVILGTTFWERRFRSARALQPNEGQRKSEKTRLPTLVDVIEFGPPLIVPCGLALDGLAGSPRVFYTPTWTFGLPWASLFQAVGAGLLFLAIPLLTWSFYLVEKYIYTRVPAEQELLQRGPYRYIRHPLYLGFFLFGIGLLLVAQNYLMFLTIGLLTGVRYVRKEEEELVGRYGNAYREYRRRTGALVPRFLRRS